MSLVAFLLVILGAGVAGYGVLRPLGMASDLAWAGSRTAGLAAATLAGWWAGVFGWSAWPLVAAIVLLVLVVVGGRALWRDRPWSEVVRGELVFWSVTAAVVVMRLDRPGIVGQEKLMDQGILASLLRTTGFPPPDMWLAGESLPYYYWGALTWAVPMRLSGVPLELAYNLTVGLVGGAAAIVAWGLARNLAPGFRGAGLVGAGLATLAGTPRGLWEMAAGRLPPDLDMWAASRQVSDTITEFPLFTLWHGDLHPHLLSMPLAGLALLLALDAGRRRSWALVAATATATGITWAANPWAMPPTVVACGLLVVCGDGRWDWPWSGGWANGGRRWLAVLSLPVGGWLITAPFHLRFSPPFQGLGLVHAWTGVRDVLLWGGVILLPVLVVVAAVVWRVLRGGDPLRGPAVLVAACAVVVVAAAAGRAVLVMIAGAAAVMIWQTVAPRSRCHRPAAALAALGLFLLAVPEVVHVVDAYGHQLHRMNTVFKAWIQAWPLLAVAIPSLMTTTVEVRWRRDLVALLVLLAALPHPAGIVWRGVTAARPGLDGLVWMADEDRALVGALRRQPAGASLVEAVGPAYSEYARLSSASGVPALLGWANHELVWRGAAIHAETERRRRIVDEIYRCGEPERIRELARTEGVDLIAVGSLERQDYGAAGLAAVRRAGPVVVEEGDAFLVAVAERSGEGS